MFQVLPKHDDPPIMAVLVTDDNLAQLAAQFGGTVKQASATATPAVLEFHLDRAHNLARIAVPGDYIVKHPVRLNRDVEILPADAFDRAYRRAEDGRELDRAVAAEFSDGTVTDWAVVAYTTDFGESQLRLLTSTQHRPLIVGMLTIAAKQIGA